MLDYVVVASGLLGSNLRSLLNVDSLGELGLIAISGVASIGLGGFIKGFWGSHSSFDRNISVSLFQRGATFLKVVFLSSVNRKRGLACNFGISICQTEVPDTFREIRS
jgi:hypothetical protein